MQRYKLTLTLGVHHYGHIYQAENIENGQMYIIEEHTKKCNSWEECISIRQVKVLRVLNHPNIIKLKEIIREDNVLFLVFEYFETNLQQWYNDISDKKKQITQNTIKKIIYQIANAINQCHANGIMHRDLCPENIYIDKNAFIKVGQFSNAEFLKKQNYTEYVTTRWYRSPEAILKLPQNNKIDIWALGCIMAELYLMRPLFHGASELDQLMQILKIMGIPNHKEYPEFHTLCQQKKILIPQIDGLGLQTLIPQASQDAIDLMNQLLNINPQKRLTIQKVLQHPFFNEMTQISEQVQFSVEEINLKKQQSSKQDQYRSSLSYLEKPKQEGEGGRKSSSSSPIRLSSDSPSGKLYLGRLSIFGQQNTPKNSDQTPQSQFQKIPDTNRTEESESSQNFSEEILSSKRETQNQEKEQDKFKLNLKLENQEDIDLAK